MPESFTDTPLLTERFDAALHYATRHHARQLRKGTPIPYSAHILAVASLVLEMHGDEDEAIGALLHDVVEDGGGRAALAEIEAAFGPLVAAIVVANSDTLDPGGPSRLVRSASAPTWTRSPTSRPAALRVSLADKLHNARSILARLPHARRRPLGALRPGPRAGDPRLLPRAGRRLRARARPRLGPAAQPYVDELRRTVDAITALAETHQGPDSRTLFDR